MIYWKKIGISKQELEVSIRIYENRGATIEHIRKLNFSHLTSDPKGQRDNISKITSSLTKKKLIRSESCYPYSREKIFYLASKGVEFVKEHIVIDPNNEMAGYGEYHGDFDARILKPPLKNIEHTMMFLDFAVKHPRNVRHNLYAVQEYEFLSNDQHSSILKQGKVRPDGEFLSKEKTKFAIEIDTGTERKGSLVSKFENYRRFFDYCKEKNKPLPWGGILFVCKVSNLTVENDQRIQTIFKAAAEGLKGYCWSVPVRILHRGGENVTTDFKSLLSNRIELVQKLNIPIPDLVSSSNNIQNTESLRKEKEEETDFLTKRFEEERRKEANQK
ncbi:replication-relaxation family protein [Metabacillus malikii]|uniref:Uncharacterized protein n=1 Tax=Metabacillus malikii TaxID=1504265 RepID=A0ABT9ZIA3_9BACI|nr:replication-relaxation family protein [Metabacillus malikii]MDQ0230945.1 hypothetical protein [Metabacillus malikii]